MVAQIVVVGSLNMDLVVRSPRIPQPGETIIGGDFLTLPGGKGANQAIAAARLGGQVQMVGRVGQDEFGELLLGNLASAGVDHDWVMQDRTAPTGVALIVVDAFGQNSIVVAPGANMRLQPTDIETVEHVIAGADILLVQLESPLETVWAAVQIAHQHSVKIVLNPAPAQALPTRLLSFVDILIPNQSETALLTGLPVATPADAETGARRLLKAGVRTVIITLGARGTLLASQEGIEIFPAFDVTPVDATAAGDAFVGAFAVALAEGHELAQVVRWGNAAGALATTRFGAQPSLPMRPEVEQLLSQGATKAASEKE